MLKLFFLFLLLPLTLFARSSKLDFTDELLRESDYFRALTVLKEHEFNHRRTKEGFIAQKKILSLHFRSEDYESLDENVKKLLSNYSDFVQEDPDVLKSEVSFFLKNYDTAFQEISKTKSELEKKYLFRAFSSKSSPLPPCQNSICTQVKILEQAAKTGSPKSPNVALALGIIPGLGQIYAGNTASGLTTLLLTGFFAATSVTAFNNNEEIFGMASAAVGSVFYLSSMYAGYETARLRNEAFIKAQRKKLRDLPVSFKLINLSFD